ncbi:phage tail tape measure C-terminal domain-containing protein [Pseudomonas sp. R32]|uniref:phage tail tape measure C-terminal domain-containing protein n=1 Tax=Pseudomonas sp. R32 TaxID=1573704 RepID=UPI00132E7C9A|nr:phage tail tape measure C-terminal domain-containing protein [Pseudomonas sp. R32]QHF27386.1 hypothetical protein PspR32_06055 [Pseudomonas sp. R32]
MANAYASSPTFDFTSLEQMLAKASRISDKNLREMQRRVEAFGQRYLQTSTALAQSTLQVSTDAFARFDQADQTSGLMPWPDNGVPMAQGAGDSSKTQASSTVFGQWMQGADQAWDDYQTKAGDVATQTRKVFEDAFASMNKSVGEFALGGSLSFSSFAKSVMADMAKMAAQTAMSKGLSMLLGFAGTAISSFFKGPAPTAGSGDKSFFQLNSTGLKYGQPVTTAMAEGGVFTNSVATGPTLAPMALFGEAGPEAVMPLRRGADGSLGVRAIGTGGTSSSTEVVIQQTINVPQNQPSAGAGEMNSQRLANAYASAARQGAAEQIGRELMPGGQIWAAIHGR